MSEGINLLDPGKKSTSDAFLRRINTARVVMLGLLFIVSVSSVILFILVALSPLPALQAQEQTLQQTLTRSKSDIVKLELVKERTVAISSILNKRTLLDQTIALVQSKLPGDSEITAIKTDSKSMTLTVESPSLQSLDSFLSSLIGFVQEKNAFSNITLTDLTTDQTSNMYAITFNVTML